MGSKNSIGNCSDLNEISIYFEEKGFHQQIVKNPIQSYIEISSKPKETLVVLVLDSISFDLLENAEFSDKNFFLIISTNFENFMFLYKNRKIIGVSKILRYSFSKSNFTKTISKKIDDLKYNNIESFYNLFRRKETIKNFYSEYLKIQNKLLSFLENNQDDKIKSKFVQKFLNRIIFLHFIQSKSLLNNDLFYFSTKFKDISGKNLNFHEKFLQPLFFKHLSEKSQNSARDIYFGTIPYLNGGLFRKDEIDDIFINNFFPNELIYEIIHLFEQYQWIYDEYADEGTESGISPEILGHIFEQSLNSGIEGEKGQKEKGAYYTPEKITNYISESTIFEYILFRVNNNFNISLTISELFGKDVKIEYYNFIYYEILLNLRILDNACGSGAFLLSALNCLIEIWFKVIWGLFSEKNLKQNIEKNLINIGRDPNWLIWKFNSFNEFCRNSRWRYYIKRYLITNCIFGVDLEYGAVEIAKLRLWLAMVVDADNSIQNIEPLPNIDYNIRSGNSLVGLYKQTQNIGLESFIQISEILDDFQKLEKIYPDDFFKLKKLLEKPDINNLILLKSKLVELYKAEDDLQKQILIKTLVDNIIEKIKFKFNQFLLNSFGILKKKSDHVSIEMIRRSNPFHWVMEFPDIMLKTESESGFDIIVGNPPYGNLMENYEKNIVKKIGFQVMSSDDSGGSNNLAALFLERSNNILKKNGFLGYIVPKSLLYISEWANTRNFLLNTVNLHKIADCGQAFDDVLLEMAIIIYQNKSPLKENKVYVQNFYQGSYSRYSTNPYLISRDFLTKDRFITEIDKISIQILENIKKNTIPLGDLCDIIRGTNLNSKCTNDPKNSIPILKGKHIQRYYIDCNEYINNDFLKGLKFEPGQVIFQRIIAHIENPEPHIKLIGSLNPDKILNVNTVTNISIKQDRINNYTPSMILLFLNSKFMNWFLWKYIYVNAVRSMDFISNYAKSSPILKIEKYHSNLKVFFDLIGNFLFELYSDPKIREKGLLKEFEFRISDPVILFYYCDEFAINSGVSFNFEELYLFFITQIKEKFSNIEKVEKIIHFSWENEKFRHFNDQMHQLFDFILKPFL
jgi:hypothetical protein